MRLLVGLLRRGRVLGAWIRLAWVDGQPSAVLYDAKGRVVSVVELDVADGVVRRSALWSTPASLVISDRCLMWRDCRPRRTPNSEPRNRVTQRTGIPSRTAGLCAVIKSASRRWLPSALRLSPDELPPILYVYASSRSGECPLLPPGQFDSTMLAVPQHRDLIVPG